MKIVIDMGHPAHFHLFKNVIVSLQSKGHIVEILLASKDVLVDLIEAAGFKYTNINSVRRNNSYLGLAWGELKKDIRILSFCKKHKPDILIGTSVGLAHIGAILNIPSVNVNEDDHDIVPLYCKLSYPFSSIVLSPVSCTTGKWEKKTLHYESFHELAYLHPNNFKPNIDIVKKYISKDKPFFLLRFADLNAHHDNGIKGLNEEVVSKIINILNPYGNIYITSEKKLIKEFEQYQVKIDPIDIHHIISYSEIYIGDSQTMAAEAGVLGVPFIRFNDFVGRIGYLRELEDKYNLGYGIIPTKPEQLIEKTKELVLMKGRAKVYKKRQVKMLNEKIDLAKLLTWFIENYPKSIQTLKTNPDYQYNFR
jgi:uncharacterized protein